MLLLWVIPSALPFAMVSDSTKSRRGLPSIGFEARIVSETRQIEQVNGNRLVKIFLFPLKDESKVSPVCCVGVRPVAFCMRLRGWQEVCNDGGLIRGSLSEGLGDLM